MNNIVRLCVVNRTHWNCRVNLLLRIQNDVRGDEICFFFFFFIFLLISIFNWTPVLQWRLLFFFYCDFFRFFQIHEIFKKIISNVRIDEGTIFFTKLLGIESLYQSRYNFQCEFPYLISFLLQNGYQEVQENCLRISTLGISHPDLSE